MDVLTPDALTRLIAGGVGTVYLAAIIVLYRDIKALWTRYEALLREAITAMALIADYLKNAEDDRHAD